MERITTTLKFILPFFAAYSIYIGVDSLEIKSSMNTNNLMEHEFQEFKAIPVHFFKVEKWVIK